MARSAAAAGATRADAPRSRRSSASARACAMGPVRAIALTVVVLDQLTKAWLVSMLDPGEIVTVIGDWLRLVHGQNSGALFGLFRDQAVLFGARLARGGRR